MKSQNFILCRTQVMYVLVFCENVFPVCYSFLAWEATNIASEVTGIALEVTDIEVNLLKLPDMLKSILWTHSFRVSHKISS